MVKLTVGQVWQRADGEWVVVTEIHHQRKHPARIMELDSGMVWPYSLDGEPHSRNPKHRARFTLTKLVSQPLEGDTVDCLIKLNFGEHEPPAFYFVTGARDAEHAKRFLREFILTWEDDEWSMEDFITVLCGHNLKLQDSAIPTIEVTLDSFYAEPLHFSEGTDPQLTEALADAPPTDTATDNSTRKEMLRRTATEEPEPGRIKF